MTYILKARPDDFIVEELASRPFAPAGPYQILCLTKTALNTEEAVQETARRLGKPRPALGYAGAKDRNAITTQHVSVRGGTLQASLSFGRITLAPAGFAAAPLSLGDLAGNRFVITVRGLSAGPTHRVSAVPNYFGEQRFSTHNVEIGKTLIRKEFGVAAARIAAHDGELEGPVRAALAAAPSDAVGALLRLPRKVLLMYLHAYQSHLFNRLLAARIATVPHYTVNLTEGPLHFPHASLPADELPLVGFGTTLAARACRAEVEARLAAEGVGLRDFIVPQLPALSLEGSWRPTVAAVSHLAIGALEPDERHSGLSKLRLTFELPKSTYATVVLKALFGE